MAELELDLETLAVAHLVALKKESQELKQKAYHIDKLIEELSDSLNGRYAGVGDA